MRQTMLTTRSKAMGVGVAVAVLLTGCEVTAKVSRSSSGAAGNGQSWAPAISDDGRSVAFTSDATTLVPGDTNSATDVLVHDAQTGTTTRVSVSTTGAQGNGPSGTGSEVAISGDGRYVAFVSQASNLVAGDPDGTGADLFVHDRQTGTTTLEAPDGRGASFDDSGRYLAFTAGGRVLVRDRHVGTVEQVPSGTGTTAGDPDLSGDGRFVALTISRDGGQDAWLWDRRDQLLDRLSYFDDGAYWPQVSDDGRTVAFGESGNDLVWIADAARGTVTRLPWSLSYAPDLSDDGRIVAFRSEDDDVVPGDTNDLDDVFTYDRTTGATARVNLSTDGAQANGTSGGPAISGDARYVAFASQATNLVADDTNGFQDVFRRDRGTSATAPAG